MRSIVTVIVASGVFASASGCRGCGATSTDPAPSSASASGSAENTPAEAPNARPLPSGIAPGSWKKGYVPSVTPPVTSSSTK
ncbi:MAG: hypothetical protein JST00_13210 [Deltaproteobacteria bacterium]|nr:hypothetical protein [Deltaproteobacteria bacterium]